MKIKQMEKEIDRGINRILHDIKFVDSLNNAYEKKASKKRIHKFEKKISKKYDKLMEKVLENEAPFNL